MEKIYSIAIRKRLSKNDHFWKQKDFEFIECKFESTGDYWFADPFLFEKNGVAYIFYEAFDLVNKKGKIGYSILKENGEATKPYIIIDEPYHLSFPFIYEHNGEIYMMPESSADWSLKVYKAVSFPYKWIQETILNPDVYACDSILFSNNGNRYLMTNEMYHNVPYGQYASCYVKNFLYNLKEGKIDGDKVLIAQGDMGIRNAGAVIELDGKTYRMGQDCRNKKYGRGLVLFEIESINPYCESIKLKWDAKDFEDHINRKDDTELVGTHTYNYSEHYEIIDFSFYSHIDGFLKIRRLFASNLKFTRRVLFYLKRKLKI